MKELAELLKLWRKKSCDLSKRRARDKARRAERTAQQREELQQLRRQQQA